jgi:cellulose synthase/poly-beta-1,6-N-acetylglucosamine synthase-like glycosyltransferase
MIAALYAVAIAGLLLYGGHWGWLALVHARSERLRAGDVPTPGARPPGEEAPATWPVVTVQLPLYNEAGVVQRLIDACARLRYPKDRLEIQILDDSTDETTALARRRTEHWRARGLDVSLVHRTDRTGYKAGALANGLRMARGDFIAVFDADFVPPPGFLRRAVPALLSGDDVGMVQARWGHLNAEHSLLTKGQAFGLDAHFALEQAGRQAAGCFINFNGTAGLWRRACIADAGGWRADTLTEDLDLSYRAQLEGWRMRYLPALEVPAELPAQMSALRAQQARWAKGGIETARKLLGTLWRSAQPLRVKAAGTVHLTAHLAYPLVLLAALTHPALIWLESTGAGPGPLYFAALSVGMVGFAGVFLAQLFAQRALYPDWLRRTALHFPLFMAGTVGLALSNTHAAARALLGRTTPFVRTPKTGGGRAGEGTGEAAREKTQENRGSDRPWWRARYAAEALLSTRARRGRWLLWAEGAMAAYSVAGLALALAVGQWAALPFQALFAAGFLLVVGASLRQSHRVRTAA